MSHNSTTKFSRFTLFTLAFILSFATVIRADVKSNMQVPIVKTSQSKEKAVKTVKLKITGMTCAGCSNHVSKVLEQVDGVIEQLLDYPGDLATVKYDESKTNINTLIKAIEKAGYKAEIVS
jgi:periplasmic mercuric ion binding protein